MRWYELKVRIDWLVLHDSDGVQSTLSHSNFCSPNLPKL
jgi:hypothetical protein